MTDQPTGDWLVADARRAVHEALVVLPAPEADRVRSLIADLETAVEARTAMRVPVVPVSSPPPDQTADRAAVLRELEERYRGHARDSAHPEFSAAYAAVANDLSRLAAEARQPDTTHRPVQHAPGRAFLCSDCLAKGYAVCMDGEQPPVHKGGNADDCPACQADGLDTIGPPYECPGPERP